MTQTIDHEGHGMTRGCFFCGGEPDMIREVRLPHPGEPDPMDYVTGKATAPTAGVVLRAAACTTHDDGLVEALLDRFGTAPGWATKSSECADPFHTGESDGEIVRTNHGDWEGEHYRCPTCGFETMTVTPPVGPDDGAYVHAAGIVERFFGPSA